MHSPPRPAPKSATSGAAPSTGNAGSTTAFDTTNSITRSDQVNYDGLDVAPPDTQIATGPTANVEVVNDLGSITIRGQANSRSLPHRPSKLLLPAAAGSLR